MEFLFHEHQSIPQTDQRSQASQQKYKTQLSSCKAKKGLRDLFSLPPASLGYQNWCLAFQAIWLV